MKVLYKLIFIVFILIFSCTSKENNLSLPQNGFEFKLFQRNSIEIPSIDGDVMCSIDDITGGQTVLTIKNKDKICLIKSIEENEVFSFKINATKYSIQCIKLVNILIGEDFGFFIVKKGNLKSEIRKDESNKIKTLLLIIEKSNIQFIRNGVTYNSKEASEHLATKWKESNIHITNLNQFIERIGSKSSMSGKPYLVIQSDGSIIPAKTWYLKQIKNSNSSDF
ncbi:MAG: DUF5329 family protein [Flavobacteriia bacterium]|nr:DUF5329 family protein [Flavobacteriia bacterium]